MRQLPAVHESENNQKHYYGGYESGSPETLFSNDPTNGEPEREHTPRVCNPE
jgi:hypothetical protein